METIGSILFRCLIVRRPVRFPYGQLSFEPEIPFSVILLMDKILHDPKDPKLWELWYIPYYGSCRILSINSIAAQDEVLGFEGYGRLLYTATV